MSEPDARPRRDRLVRPPRHLFPRTQSAGPPQRERPPHLRPDDVAQMPGQAGHDGNPVIPDPIGDLPQTRPCRQQPLLRPLDQDRPGQLYPLLRRRLPGDILLGPHGQPPSHHPRQGDGGLHSRSLHNGRRPDIHHRDQCQTPRRPDRQGQGRPLQGSRRQDRTHTQIPPHPGRTPGHDGRGFDVRRT